MKKKLDYLKILLITLSVLAVFHILGGTHQAQAISGISGNNWMSAVPDNRYLHEINLPGTHDAGMQNAYSASSLSIIGDRFAGYAVTQSLYIPQQLDAGVRYLDLRWTLHGGTLLITHGRETGNTGDFDARFFTKDSNGTYVSFDMVSAYLKDFLRNHPTETVIIDITNESGSADTDSIKQKLKQGLDNLASTINPSTGKPYLYTQNGNKLYTYMPALGTVRGQIFVISDLYQSLGYGASSGFSNGTSTKQIAGTTFNTQNDYESQPSTKWSNINAFLNARNCTLPTRIASHLSNGNIVFTSSCVVDVSLSIIWGGGDNVKPRQTADYVNPRLYTNGDSYLKSAKGKYYGWIISDFVTSDMARLVYEHNFSGGLDMYLNDRGTVTTKIVKYGESYPAISVPSAREGYTFDGYYSGKDGTEVKYYNSSGNAQLSKCTLTDNITLYANWKADEYNITYSTAADYSYSANKPVKVEYGQDYTFDVIVDTAANDVSGMQVTVNNVSQPIPEPVMNDKIATYSFTVKDVKSAQNIVVSGINTNTYTITYETNGGILQDGAITSYEAGTTPELPNSSYVAKTGYAFDGWFNNKNFDGTAVVNIPATAKEDITYYAKWTANKYTIKYDGGQGAANVPEDQTDVEYDTSVKLREKGAMVKQSYNFLGWSDMENAAEPKYLAGQEVKNLTSVAGDVVTMYAVWEKHRYTLKYSMNGGNGNVESFQYDMDTEVEITDYIPTRTGYIFNGWGTTLDGSGTIYTYGQSMKITKDTTLYAKWTQIKTIEATSAGYTGVYDGQTHGITVTVTAPTSGAVVKYGTVEGEYTLDESPVITNASDSPLTVYYQISSDGYYTKTGSETVTINKRSITLTSKSASKAYDGTHLTNTNVTVSGDNFVLNEGVESYTFDTASTVILPGETTDNKFGYTLKEGTNANNYEITPVYGTLTITNRTDDGESKKYEITLEANSGEEKYDGTEKTVSGLKETEFKFNGVTYTVTGVTAGAALTNAGKADIAIEGTPVVTDNNGNVLTEQFKVNKVKGTLTVNKRDVILTSATDTKEYDGNALINSNVTVTGDGFAEGEGAYYRVTGTRTLVGASENTFEYKLYENTNADNYNITKNNGTITVTNRGSKYKITVTANSGEFKYDGTERRVTGVEQTEFDIDGNKFIVTGMTAEAAGTNAGKYTVNVTGTPVVKDADGKDVSEQFAVNTASGELTINKRSITLTSATDTKKFDHIPLTNDEVMVSGDGFVEGEGIEKYDVTGSQTEAGRSENTFTYILNKNTVPENYEINIVYGILEVLDSPDILVHEMPYRITEFSVTGTTAKVEIEHSDDASEGVLIIAVYGVNGNLIEFSTEPVTQSDVYKTVLLKRVDGAKTAKAFIWDSLDKMEPLSDFVLAQFN